MHRIVGPCACGSLKPELQPGTFVVCDQFVDRTRGREDTFYDGPQTTHVSAADPYCRDLREVLAARPPRSGIPVVGRRHRGGDPGPALLDQGGVALVQRGRAGTW